ncbi:extracellular calcium-sensing receptor-like [Erpetoichthys calabaricus]|uniref:extracellular calcium-sensing receptor-like n=1 Tax=Erpetoichthys calabaricus TaxID=27687 RepID=UPI0010A067F6|nr:extracellular calcium-sensing receptor-like [Erpetoichthys calabaricus]
MIHILYAALYLRMLNAALYASEPSCKVQGTFQLNSLYKKGDIMLGGIFEISTKTIVPDLSFQMKPGQWRCDGVDISIFQRAQTMIFAIEEINRNPSFLPNITLGYRIIDNCEKLPIALRAAAALVGGLDDISMDFNCKGSPPVLAIVGDPTSTNSIALSRILSLFRMPLISYYATCACLSNKQEHPSFFRTIPSDTFQVKAMIEILKHFGWTWVGAIASEDDYGQNAMAELSEQIKSIGCLSFVETIPKVNQKMKIIKILETIKISTVNVIIVFASGVDISALVKEVVSNNIIGKQWIASDAWSTTHSLATKENFASFGGTIGITVRRGEIPGLESFLVQLHPNTYPNNTLIIQFWEAMFGCTFQQNINNQTSSSLGQNKICTGDEDIQSKKTPYSDVSQLRGSYNVYKAVYALGYALHNAMNCEYGKGPFMKNSCVDVTSMQPWQLFHYLKYVNFTNHLGERVAFDKNGDVLAVYDILNWQWDEDGSVKIKTVGLFDMTAPSGKELLMNESSIFWNFDSGKVPESICSKSCLPGTRKATKKGKPICCFDCVPCADGAVSHQTDAIECIQCPEEFWSNPGRNLCVLREVEFLSYSDAMGITLSTTALSGASFSVAVLVIFMQYRYTPVVKANNSELSFLLLTSLTLCFLCALCFIGQPSYLTCMLRHVVFGISFVLCISCILVKTIVVIMAFRATMPGNNVMKWFGTAQQRGTVFLFTFIQSLICIIWLMVAPPIPARNTKYQNAKVILECDVGSLTGFSCLLGYIGLLACICFILAFLARNLPDTFNETKFITFSMLIFCAVWITFIPAYISSPGKYTVAVEIFAILASSFGLLFAIFAPKCYIIILKPERNSKRALMSKSALTK